MVIYLVYQQVDLYSQSIVKAFQNEKDAQNYCMRENVENKPIHDDWGYVGGINHGYFEIVLK